MLSLNKKFQEGLQEKVDKQNKDLALSSKFNWINEIEDINFWSFLSVNHLHLDKLFTLLDVETDATSGWEKFVETIGMFAWEDRRWCQLYHDGTGPTKTALLKMTEKDGFDKDLSLKAVLLLIKEMDRLDILTIVKWKFLIENFNKTKDKLKPKYKECSLEKVKKFPTKTVDEPIVGGENLYSFPDVKSKKIKRQKRCIILLYASDAAKEALKIKEQLRNGNSKRKKINVVNIYNENAKAHLRTDPFNVLHKWFNQVQYVVPVLSPLFLEQIQSLNSDYLFDSESNCNRMIYKMLSDLYLSHGSKNYRCRAVIPIDFRKQLVNHPVLQGNGLLIMASSDNFESVEQLAVGLMDSPLDI